MSKLEPFKLATVSVYSRDGIIGSRKLKFFFSNFEIQATKNEKRAMGNHGDGFHFKWNLLIVYFLVLASGAACEKDIVTHEKTKYFQGRRLSPGSLVVTRLCLTIVVVQDNNAATKWQHILQKIDAALASYQECQATDCSCYAE
jgi:hypothetical protein